MPFAKTDMAGAEWFTVYEPVTGVAPIGEVAPSNLQAGVEFVKEREICGLTAPCAPAAWGQVTEETSAAGRRTFTVYDPLGRPVVSGDDVHAEVAELRYARPLRVVCVDAVPDGFGGGYPAYVAARKPVDQGIDVWTHTWTDGLGRTLLVAEDWEDEQGNKAQRVSGGELRDWRGRVVETPWPCLSPGTALASQSDWLHYQPANGDLGVCVNDPPRDTLEYDVLSRVRRQIRPDGAEVVTDYSHFGGAAVADVELIESNVSLTRTRTTTTPLSKWTIRYDAVTNAHDVGQPLPAGLVGGASELHTIERMDALGRRTTVWRTGQGGESTTFAFDGFDRLIQYSDPDQGNWELDYDGAGRLAARRLVDPMTGSTDVAMEWAYDKQGRVLTEWSYDDASAWTSGQATSWWDWTYDVDPGAQGPVPLMAGGEIGQPSEAVRTRRGGCGNPQAVDVEQVLSWRYDRRGRPVEEAFSMHSCAWQTTGAPGTLVAQHAWTTGDAKGRTWMPWSGEEISWQYDTAGRPHAVVDSAGPVATATYEVQGRFAQLDYRNGVEQEYVYAQGQGSTQALEHSLTWNAQGQALFSRQYDWDAAGNLTGWEDDATVGAQPETWDCDYDGVGTLLGCRGSQGEWFEYAYDALGNLISEDVEVGGTSRWASQYARGTGGTQVLPGFSAPLNAPVARVVGPTSTPSPTDPGQSFFYDGRGHLIAQRYHDPHQSAGAQVTTAGLAGPSLGLLPWSWERRFSWNAQGRLDSVRVASVSSDDEVSRYWYGPGGTRIAERATPLSSEPDPTWTQSRRWAGVRTVEPELEAPRFTLNITLGSTVVAQKTVEPSGQGGPTETTRFLGGDHLGSASIVTDEHGDLVRGVRYEPYGRIRAEWGPESAQDDYAGGSTDDLFNGKPRNRKAFGLSGVMGGDYALEGYDYGARIYLPELSRWASADSITPDTVWEANAFAYVRNNPLKYVDPDGHISDEALQGRMENPGVPKPVGNEGRILVGIVVGSFVVPVALLEAGPLILAILDSAGTVLGSAETGGLAFELAANQTLANGALGLGARYGVGLARLAPAASALAPAVDNLGRAGRHTSEAVSLFHGTSKAGAASIRSKGIDLAFSRSRTDFGKGFYVTLDRGQAQRWVDRMHEGGEVLEFRIDVDALNMLKTLELGSMGSGSIARFLRHNRLGGRLHGYDLVSGPLLGNPGRFLNGAEPRLFGQQTSFHTRRGIRLLDEGLVD